MGDLEKTEGKELSPYTFFIEKGKIKEFVQAVGDSNPVYVDKVFATKLGYKDVIAPPTFGTSIDFWGGPDFPELCRLLGLDPLQVLHGGQEYVYYREIYPGDEITARPKLAKFIRRQGKSQGIRMITLETEYYNQRGEKVLMARNLIVERFS